LEDVIRRLGTEDFARLRIGVGQPAEGWSWVDYVLSKFTKDEIPVVAAASCRAADAADDWAREGLQYCMNRYN
jgi:PTH1 family peptidyl-tRNA hydrolase